MDNELKSQWVAALRSGKYKQTQGTLKDSTGFCCLGVLREIAGHDALPEADDEFLLDKESALSIGIEYGMQKTLSHMNDGFEPKEIKKHTFAEIADYIEAKL